MSESIRMDALSLESNEAPKPETEPQDQENSYVQQNPYWYYAVLFFMGLLATGSLVCMYKYSRFEGNKVQSFVHIYEGSVNPLGFPLPPVGQLSINGPFLGKVRVSGTGLAISNGGEANKKQSYCDDASKVAVGLKEACNMMRIPTMYFGHIHATWSVLGAQSVPAILKYIYLICFAFSCFMLSDLYVRFIGPDRFYPARWATTRWIRTGLVLLAIVAFLVAICLDLRNEMHQYENGTQKYAIGSVSTGAFFWIATFLIICSSQIDEAEQGDWHKHVNLNMSYLILLLLPLFVILGLLDLGKNVVDVHIQLIFFSSIFFALLDIFLMRVMPVLEDLKAITTNGVDKEQIERHVLYIQIFVVLACILCKLFVYVPTLQLVGRYYIGDKLSSFSGIMLVIQIVFLVLTSLIDLIHIAFFQDKLVYTIGRTVFVYFFIVASLAMTWTIEVPAVPVSS
jgi:hypothetical protein